MYDTRPRHPDVDYDANAVVCEHCGLEYDDFRTGMTFKEVRNLYWVSNPDSETWKYKRRNTVLGKWREIKLKMWDEHLYLCAAHAMFEDEDTADEEIPF